MKTTFSTMAVAISFVLAGCTSAPIKGPADYPQLNVKADESNTLIFTKPGLDLGSFKKAYVAPVQIQVSNAQGVSNVSDADAQKLAAYTEKSLKEQLGKQMVLVSAPGADVLSVRFRILELEPTSKAQIAMMLPPFSLINMLSPKGAFHGSITLAGELIEGNAKDASVAFVATRSRPGIDASVAFSTWAVAEKVIDNAAERLAKDLEGQRAAKR